MRHHCPHRLRGSMEVHYIPEGEAIMQIDDEARVVKVGDAVYTSVQYIENIGKLLSFLCALFLHGREMMRKS
ncbi:hypothetical protein [Methanothermobacter sp. CaT2]|uniref:hypothetical protein n=1 Tax=Methanothermobacter sp. CaT2 TaxID=866790 RepID=UPI001E50072A|nr:hypothetical protein [Methanothermobacter sp. CaT2]